MYRHYALYTLEGVPNCDVTTHHFSTADKLGLSLLRFCKRPCEDVVMIVHGLTTSTDMFIMPEHNNLVRYLHDRGFTDVWCLDFRMSNRHPYNMTRHRYTMDDIALFDYPAAIQTIRAAIGKEPRLHVITHCLGAVSFMMSLFGGVLDGVRSAIANSVALTPRVPGWSRFKLRVAPFFIDYIINQPYVSPNWGTEAGFSPGKIVSRILDLGHRECNVSSCHMLSFMWGTGKPALYNHENLLDVTHERGGDLYGPTAPHYHRHVHKMVQAGHAVKYNPANAAHKSLPDDYLERAGECTVPVLFMTGRDNRIFTNSNIVCYNELEQRAPGRHELAVFDGYGHQDVFMGKSVDRDVFPRILTFLQKHATRDPLQQAA